MNILPKLQEEGWEILPATRDDGSELQAGDICIIDNKMYLFMGDGRWSIVPPQKKYFIFTIENRSDLAHELLSPVFMRSSFGAVITEVDPAKIVLTLTGMKYYTNNMKEYSFNKLEWFQEYRRKNKIKILAYDQTEYMHHF